MNSNSSSNSDSNNSDEESKIITDISRLDVHSSYSPKELINEVQRVDSAQIQKLKKTMKNDENINSMNYTKGGWNTQFMNTPKCKSGQISYIRIGKEYQCCMPKQNPLNLNPPNYPPQEIWNPYILPDYQVNIYLNQVRKSVESKHLVYREDVALKHLALCHYSIRYAYLTINYTLESNKEKEKDILFKSIEHKKKILKSENKYMEKDQKKSPAQKKHKRNIKKKY